MRLCDTILGGMEGNEAVGILQLTPIPVSPTPRQGAHLVLVQRPLVSVGTEPAASENLGISMNTFSWVPAGCFPLPTQLWHPVALLSTDTIASQKLPHGL